MGTVLDTRLFVKNRDGLFVEYKEPYASIECETEEDFKQIQEADRKSTRLNSSHSRKSRMPSSA